MKDIKGFEGKYAITEDGQVWSYYKKDFMKPFLQKKGYLYINLYQEYERKSFAIHRLVAQTYLENPNNLPEVNHKDENKLNNNVNNLEWCNRSYNIHYGTAISRSKEKQQQYHPNQKKVLCIETGQIYHSAMEAKRCTGVDNTSISMVCNGKRQTAGGYHWKYIE